MFNKVLTLLLFVGVFKFLASQELLADVTVAVPNTKDVSVDPKVFKTLENAVQEFLNNRKWTNDEFKEYEKIEVSVFIGIKDQVDGQNNDFLATMTFISKRPIFNSTYNSTVLNIIDNEIRFTYQENQPIEFNENSFTSNLSHLLAYYAYMIIGVDYDTYQELGGQKYLEKAADLVALVDGNNGNIYKGWKSYGKNQRNRYWMITHMLNGRYEPYRKAQYIYHRLGLDNFYSQPEVARENIIVGLEELSKVTSDNPNLSLVQMWSEAKQEEIVNAFSKAPDLEKTLLLTVAKKADPANIKLYEKIKE